MEILCLLIFKLQLSEATGKGSKVCWFAFGGDGLEDLGSGPYLPSCLSASASLLQSDPADQSVLCLGYLPSDIWWSWGLMDH